jgi:hypothetical protein
VAPQPIVGWQPGVERAGIVEGSLDLLAVIELRLRFGAVER